MFRRLEEKLKTNLLRNAFRKIVIDSEGDIISFELQSTFTYLLTLASQFSPENEDGSGSRWVQYRPQFENEPLDMPVERFLAYLCFEQRSKLNQLGIEMGDFD